MAVKKKPAKKMAKKKVSPSKSKTSAKKVVHSTGESTHIIAILDRSWSMNKVAKDAINGYNSFIAKQKELKDKTTLTGILFDNLYEPLYNGKAVDIQDVPVLTDKVFVPRGMTALYHSIGRAVVDYKTSGNKADKVLVIIITDGKDNVEGEFTRQDISDLIQYQKTKDWQFLFLCSTEDAVTVGSELNISDGNVFKYKNDSKGNQELYDKVSFATTNYRNMSASFAKGGSDSLFADE